MATQFLEAKDYATRQDLETAFGKLETKDTVAKDIVIRGTREELARIGLSDENTFWGAKCIITDTPTVPVSQDKAPNPVRGERHESKIN